MKSGENGHEEEKKAYIRPLQSGKLHGLKNQKTGAVFLHHSPSPGVARGVPGAAEAGQLLGDNGTSHNSRWASLPALTGGTGAVLHTWSAAWAPPAPSWGGHGPFPLEISQTGDFSTISQPFLKPCNLISSIIWGWWKPRGSRNQTTHNQEALRLTALAEDWKTPFSKR